MAGEPQPCFLMDILLRRVWSGFGRWLIIGIALTTAASAQPFLLGLQANGEAVYFDEQGKPLARIKLLTGAKPETLLDIELGEFHPENAGPELLVLREGFWLDVYPLPTPKDKSIKRLEYLRFAPRTGFAPANFNLGTLTAADANPLIGVFVKKESAPELTHADTYGLPEVKVRPQKREAAATLPGKEPGPWVAASVGLLTDTNFAAVAADGTLWTGRFDSSEGVRETRRIGELPKGTTPRRIRLVRDQLYVLDGANTLHRWQRGADGTWKAAGKPVVLKGTAGLVAIVPLQR
jgi:hypothetical protein